MAPAAARRVEEAAVSLPETPPDVMHLPFPSAQKATSRISDEPVCPHCGEIVGDAWELDFTRETIEVECAELGCRKRFSITRDVRITYETREVEQQP